MIIRSFNLFFFTLIILILSGCARQPEPIEYGNDVCDFCRMNITDNKFAAELITKKGKVYKFDSIECLFQFKQNAIEDKDNIHSEWVNDFSNPGVLINLKSSFFLKSDVFRSPMGMNVLSFSSEEKLNEIKIKFGGEVLNYYQVENLAISENH